MPSCESSSRRVTLGRDKRVAERRRSELVRRRDMQLDGLGAVEGQGLRLSEIRDDYHQAIPLNRYGTEAEIAEVIYFLSSDRASYVNGQIVAVDGGFESTGIGLATLRAGEVS